MKRVVNSRGKFILILMGLILILNLTGCGKSSHVPKPEGKFYCIQEDYGEGLQARLDIFEEEYISFNSNGTGVWKLGLKADFTWKLKKDQLTIVRTILKKVETFQAVWDGESILLDYDGADSLYEKREL